MSPFLKSITAFLTLTLSMAAIAGCGSSGGDDSTTNNPQTPTTTSLGTATIPDGVIRAKIIGNTVTLWNYGSPSFPYTSPQNTIGLLMSNPSDTSHPINTGIWPSSAMMTIDVFVYGIKRGSFTSASGTDFRSSSDSRYYRQYVFTNANFALSSSEASALPDITFKVTKIAPTTTIETIDSFGVVNSTPTTSNSAGEVDLNFPTTTKPVLTTSG